MVLAVKKDQNSTLPLYARNPTYVPCLQTNQAFCRRRQDIYESQPTADIYRLLER